MPEGNLKLKDQGLAKDSVSAASLFKAKTRRTDSVKIKINDTEVEVKVVALPNKQLTTLLQEHPPRKNKPEDGPLGYNVETFPPVFLSKAVTDPEMSAEDWAEIWSSPDWSPGELGHLLDVAWSVSNRGFDVPFGARG